MQTPVFTTTTPGKTHPTHHGKAELAATMPPDRGIEMSTVGIKEDSFRQGSNWSVRGPSYDAEPQAPLRRWLDSFRRDPNRRVLPKYPVPGSVDDDNRLGIDDLESMRSSVDHGAHYFDLRAANISTANTMLARELRGRHLQMIAIGGSIGENAFFFCLFLSPVRDGVR